MKEWNDREDNPFSISFEVSSWTETEGSALYSMLESDSAHKEVSTFDAFFIVQIPGNVNPRFPPAGFPWCRRGKRPHRGYQRPSLGLGGRPHGDRQ